MTPKPNASVRPWRPSAAADRSFQADLDNVQARTGKSPDELKALAEAAGLVEGDDLKAGVKAT